MASVVVVHGIGRQFSGPHLLRGPITDAVRDGVGLAGTPAPEAGDIGVAFYGDVFRAQPDKGGPAHSPGEQDDDFEQQLALLWWAKAAALDPHDVQPPGNMAGAKARTPKSVKAALRALSMSRFATRLTEPLLFRLLGQVRDYLADDAIGEQVRAKVGGEIGDDTEVVVGHSLGSVIAYEALCAGAGPSVRTLVTLGSPLGIPLVFDRLTPRPRGGVGAWPSAVGQWTNICDPYDVVALQERLTGLFRSGETDVRDESLGHGAASSLKDRRVDNGWRAHDLIRYLTARVTGRAIGEGLAS
ncbi:hypothetical protein [Streptomyces asoensis]|uniref:Mucin n=1 Tax=Streptomyces asoensis TaxID=249586 RepID=A0ABQ3S588_9ACTN|nr:hypothetical protein [Streptomyces asoensis]GGQ64861.1 hypothetical protein GCM10010496_30240 [Streptomyces asoensis]GHI63294.1 hypothetical protein Saso_49440 [Streptomyces asoensis]